MTLVTDLAGQIDQRDEQRGWTREPHRDPLALVAAGKLDSVKRAFVSGKPNAPQSLAIEDWRLRLIHDEVWRIPGPELARQYLRYSLTDWLAEHGKRLDYPRIPWRKQALSLGLSEGAPAQWFEPPEHDGGPWSYVDAQACYPSIIARLSPVCEYRPGWPRPLLRLIGPEWPRVGEWIGDADPEPRTAWYGCLRAHKGVPELRRGQLTTNGGAVNRWFSPDLIGIVMDACHALAGELIALCPSACAWNTDALVCRPDDAPLAIAHARRRWGLSMRVEAEGPGFVWGRVTHAIGPRLTKDVAKGKAERHGPMSTLRVIPPAVADLLAAALRGSSR